MDMRFRSRRGFGLAALCLLLSIMGPRAQGGSVLDALPDDTVVCVWTRSLRQLSDEVDALVAALVPQAPPPKEILAKALAGVVGAGFTSDEELAALGFNLDEDFALAVPRLSEGGFTAIIHVSDLERVRAVLEREGAWEANEYKGVPLVRAGERAHAFVGDLLLFTTAPDGLPRVIDTLQGEAPALAASEAFRSLEPGIGADGDDVFAYVDVATLVEESEEGPQVPDGEHQEQSPLQNLQNAIQMQSLRLQRLTHVGMGLRISGTDVALRIESRYGEGGLVGPDGDQMNRPLLATRLLPSDAGIAGSYVVDGRMMARARETMPEPESVLEEALSQAPAEAAETAALVTRSAEALSAIPADYAEEVGYAVRFADAGAVEIVAVVPVAGRNAGDVAAAIKDALLRVLAREGTPPAVTPAKTEYLRWGEAQGWELDTPALRVPGVPQGESSGPPAKLGLWYTADGPNLLLCVGPRAETLEWVMGVTRGGTPLADVESVRAVSGAGHGVMTAYVSPTLFLRSLVESVGRGAPEAQVFSTLLQNMPASHAIAAHGRTRANGAAAVVAVRLGDLMPLVQLAQVLAAMGGRSSD
jgi:hypothetical protein